MKKNPVSIPHTVWYADDIRRGERARRQMRWGSHSMADACAGEAAFQVCRSAYPDARHWLVLCAVMVITAAMAMWSRGWATAVGIEVTLLAQKVTNRCRKRPRWHAKHG